MRTPRFASSFGVDFAVSHSEEVSMNDPRKTAPAPQENSTSCEKPADDELLLPFSHFEREPLCEAVPGTPLVETRTNCLYGQSGDGKTFIALEWIFNAAESGPVLYIAGEDEEEARKRAIGYADFYKIPETTTRNIAFYPDRIRALDPALEDVSKLIAACKKQDFIPHLVVIDTLGACFEGFARAADPVDGTACRVFLTACSRFERELGAASLFVHHTRKDSTTFYGNNILRTNSRAIFRTEKSARIEGETTVEYVTVIQEKNKSGPNSAAQTYKFQVHCFKFRGKFVSTCIPVLQKESLPVGDEQALSAQQLSILMALSSKLNPPAGGLTRPHIDAVLRCKKDKSIRVLRSLGVDGDGLGLVEPNPEGRRNVPRYRLTGKGQAAAVLLLDSGKTWREFLELWAESNQGEDPAQKDGGNRQEESGPDDSS